jgi:hypothetical protein
MRTLAILLLLAGGVLPGFAANPVTVDLVSQLLVYARNKSDAKMAEELFDLELTERASSATLARWDMELPGPKSRQAMNALADASAFLRLPPEELPGTPAPDPATQDSLLALCRNYVTGTIPKLPNFFATRTTTLFSDEPMKMNSLTLNTQYAQMRLVGVSTDRAYFQEGKEVIVAENGKRVELPGTALTTKGVFGEAMELILSDILPSGPAWYHWESDPDGAPIAVFRYAVAQENSHYAVNTSDDQQQGLPVAYSGEIAMNPADGTIRRLTALASLSAKSPMTKAGVMVEYGPVEIGGTSYICPVKSVSLAVIHAQNNAPALSARPGPSFTQVNDVQFTEYHRFRTESRILTGNDAAPDSTPPASSPAPNPTPTP